MAREKLTAAVSKAYPNASEILVSFPDAWELIETLEQKRGARTSPLYIAAMPPETERPTREHFAGLSPDVNLSLTSYQLFRFFEPWPMPAFLVDWNPYLGQGWVAGQKDMKVQLRDVGDAQAWMGHEAGVLWECFLHERPRQEENWQEQWAQVWQVVERSLGVKRIFTPDHEPTIEPEAYRDFLERLGYLPEPTSPRWWSKTIESVKAEG